MMGPPSPHQRVSRAPDTPREGRDAYAIGDLGPITPLIPIPAKAARAVEDEHLAQAAYRRLESPSADAGEDRRSWASTGKVGAEKARRLGGLDQ